MNRTSIQAVIDIDRRAREATASFQHTATAATTYDHQLGQVFGDLRLGVADIMTVAVLSESHTLLTGPSGEGKTELVKLLCGGIFGEDWYLQKLTPSLNEDVFTNVDMVKLRNGTLSDAVTPAHFLALPATILDEINRTPPALTNVLLGFLDGCVETRAGRKFTIGHQRFEGEGDDRRYHVAFATMNDGADFEGSFPLDLALSRRFTLRIPLGELPLTPEDIVALYQGRRGRLTHVSSCDALESVLDARDAINEIEPDPLAYLYLGYLSNLGRCCHSVSGFHENRGTQELCMASECRILKLENGFCPSVGKLSLGVGIYLLRSAMALAAIRAARILNAVDEVFQRGDDARIKQLRKYAGRGAGDLHEAVVDKYLDNLEVSLEDIVALVPFVALGKVWMAEEYVVKNFGGSRFRAMSHFAMFAHQQLVGFIRQNEPSIRELDNGKADKLIQRLDYTERSTDPTIKHVLTPYITRKQEGQSPEEVAQLIRAASKPLLAARRLVS